MVLFAVLHIFAFNYRGACTTAVSRITCPPPLTAVPLYPAAVCLLSAEFALREGVVHTTVMQNVKQVISQKDVVQDAYHNFMPSYQVCHRFTTPPTPCATVCSRR